MHDGILMLLALAAATGLFFVHFEARRRPGLWGTLVPLDLSVAVLAVVAMTDAPTFEGWMQEDGWAEWGTVHAFMLAAALVGWRAWRPAEGENTGWLPRLGLAAVAAFCVFVAGEEISWGQRLLAFEPPEIFLQENYQQELNVHNLLKDKELAGFELDSRFLVAMIALGYGALLPGLRRLGKARWLQPTIDTVAPPWELAPYFGAIALVELAYPADLAGEACELVLGVLFLAAASMHARPSVARWRSAVLVLPFALGVVTQPVVSAVVYGADEDLVEQAQDELEMLADDLIRAGVMKKRLRKKSRVHKRVFTAVQSGYFEPGTSARFLDAQATPADPDAEHPRRDRRGYFLDPWNNPYWVLVTRKSGYGAFYSFGPNRRRDTRLPKKSLPADFQPAGDDILVVFSVSDPHPPRP